MIENALGFLQWLVTTHGVLGLFVAMSIQAVVPPIPSDIFPIFAVAFGMNPFIVVLLASTGSTLGGIFNFYLARRGGKPRLEKFFNKKHIDKFEGWFTKWGPYALMLGRATPFVSSDALAYVAGLSNMNLKTFVPLAFIGIFLRCAILVTIGTAISVLPIAASMRSGIILCIPRS